MRAAAGKFIGKGTVRKDAVEFVTGGAQYIDDLRVPGMLHCKVLRSPHAHANIARIEVEQAERAPGVKAVLTYRNAPNWVGGMPPTQPVLDRRLRYVGDAVALVAATAPELAEEALERIEVEYEVLPAVLDLDQALRPGAPSLYDAYPGNVLPSECPAFGRHSLTGVVRGDVEAGFAAADVVAEGTYGYENLPNPLPPEPPGAIVKWDGPDKLTVWTAAQCPSLLKWRLGSILGFPEVRVIGTYVGGSYGSKIESWQVVLYAAALARATNRPVKLCYTKEEHFAAYKTRIGSRIHAKIGMKRDGTVTAVEGEWLVDVGAYSNMAQGMIAVGCGEMQLMMSSCDNWSLPTKTVVTNRTATGAVRGYGGQELKSALIPLWTLAMEKAGLDPVEVFKTNYVKPGGQYLWRDGALYTCSGKDYTEAMERGAEAFGWQDKWKGWLIPTAARGTKRTGVGVGVHGNADSGEDETEAYVRLNGDGRVVLHCLVAESGMGERSSVCKMVAEVLGVPLETVSITDPDTMVNPFNCDLVGSRGTYAVGSAVVAAAEHARDQLLELAARRLEAPKEILEIEDGFVFAQERPDERVHWRRVLGPVRTITGTGRFEPDYTKPNFIMTFVEVEVDVSTGACALTRVVQATDAGRIIDPPVLDGQLYGGLGSAGIDTALFEETIVDPVTGRILNPNLIDYKWRVFPDLPAFRNVILETGIPTHRFRAVGVGEVATAPGPSAVLMAVSNAIGARFTRYPATPERILQALQTA